jgi:hypothetical protein
MLRGRGAALRQDGHAGGVIYGRNAKPSAVSANIFPLAVADHSCDGSPGIPNISRSHCMDGFLIRSGCNDGFKVIALIAVMAIVLFTFGKISYFADGSNGLHCDVHCFLHNIFNINDLCNKVIWL